MATPDRPSHRPQAGADAPPPLAARAPATARTLLVAGGLTLAVLVVAAAIASLGVDAGDPVAPPADIAVVETPVPLDERVPPTRQEPLPDLVLDGFDGAEPVDLASYRGQPLVVNLWATWCAPCIEEMPDLQQVSRELEGRVAVLGVNVRDARANAAAFVEDLGVTYDLAADPDAELFRALEVFGMPTTLLVTPEGTIVYRHTGLLDAEGLRELLGERLGVDVSQARRDRLVGGRAQGSGTVPAYERVGQHQEVSASDG